MIRFLNRQVPDKTVKRRFEDVYSDYNLLMSKYIYKRIQNKETSDSLTSDVFFKAFKNYENYDPEKASEKTWLFCIANNVLKNHYRDKKITEPLETCENSLSAAYENDLGEAVYYQECRECLAAALKELSENQRKIIVFKYFKDMSSEDIAKKNEYDLGKCQNNLNESLKKTQRNSKGKRLYLGGF